MSIDLERSLDELARSVHDEALAERLNGQVHRMVTQVRRRRAARYTGTSVIGMSAAAAVVIGGIQLAERDRSAPVATDAPAPGPTPVCGDAGPTTTQAQDLVLEVEPPGIVAYGTAIPLDLFLFNVLSMSVTSYAPVDVAVLQDGVVVATAQVAPEEFGIVSGIDATRSEVVVTPCGGDTPLGDGEYTLVASAGIDLADGTSRNAVSAPVPFTITGDPLGVVEDELAGQRALEELLVAAESSQVGFPECGAVVQPATDAPIALTLTLDEPSTLVDEQFTAQVAVRSTFDLPDTAELTANNPEVVLTRDGVVVSRRWSTELREVPIDLGADGTATLEAPGTVSLCALPGTDAPEIALPPGTYQAYAVFTLTITDPADEVPWDPEVVRSEPVDITIG